MNRIHLMLLLAVLLAACGSKTKTSFKVQVSFNTSLDQLRLSGIAVGMGDAGTREPALVPDTPHELLSPTTVIILLPDGWDGKTVDLTVAGLTAGQEVTRAQARPQVQRGVEVPVEVYLTPCDGGCTDGDAGVDGGVSDAATPPPDMVFVHGPSCNDLGATCGPSGAEGCCCESPLVTGNEGDSPFYRSYDGVDGGSYRDTSWPATVSDFRLDKYEITVGRFRKFVESYLQNMTADHAGRNPNNPNDYGWNEVWNTNGSMATDATALTEAINGCYLHTWLDTPDPLKENLPMNCITWYEAFAFCIWDGGRLPTEAEWNYAAAGGLEQRAYPWSNPPGSTEINNTYAVYGATTGSGTPQNVGSKSPTGNGLWGQADLAGNVWEWTIDKYATPYPMPCNNCANLTVGSYRMVRGGNFENNADILRVAYRFYYNTSDRYYFFGARCARSP